MRQSMRPSLFAQYMSIILMLLTPPVLFFFTEATVAEIVGLTAWPFLILLVASGISGSTERRSGVPSNDENR